MVGRALAYWETLRGERRFPGRNDCASFDRVGMADNIFVVAVTDDEAGDEIVECGPAFRKALGMDPVGRKAMKILPSATERGLSFCRVAAEMKKPIADVGHFTNADGEEVMYRSILLPLSDDQNRVNYLLGAFSYKIAA
jgi:hypothetical protein